MREIMKLLNTDIPNFKLRSPGMVVNTNTVELDAYHKKQAIAQAKNEHRESLELRINNLEHTLETILEQLQILVKGK